MNDDGLARTLLVDGAGTCDLAQPHRLDDERKLGDSASGTRDSGMTARGAGQSSLAPRTEN
jgi:hypothetical protein